MEMSELKGMSEGDLSAELDRMRRKLYDLRTQAVTEKIEDPRLIRKTRKDIARVLTLQRQRQMAAQAQS